MVTTPIRFSWAETRSAHVYHSRLSSIFCKIRGTRFGHPVAIVDMPHLLSVRVAETY